MAIEEMNPQAVLVSPEDEQVRVSGPIRGPAQGGGQAVPPPPQEGPMEPQEMVELDPFDVMGDDDSNEMDDEETMRSYLKMMEEAQAVDAEFSMINRETK